MTGVTATLGTDFTALSSVTIPAGSDRHSFRIPIINDTRLEPDETFRIAIDTGNLPPIATAGSLTQVTITITDDEKTTSITLIDPVLDSNLVEGLTYNLGLRIQDGTVFEVGKTVTYGILFSGTATRGSDYTLSCGSPVGATVTCSNLNSGSATITVTVNQSDIFLVRNILTLSLTSDSSAESGGETIEMEIRGGVMGTAWEGTIVDAPSSVTVTFTLASFPGVHENNGPIQPVIRITPPAGQDFTLPLTMTGVTATAGTDFTALSSVTIPGGHNLISFDIPLLDDALPKPDETFTIAIDTGNLPAIATAGSITEATLTIANDDAPDAPAIVTVTPLRDAVSEGELAWFNIDLDRPNPQTIHVIFRLETPTRVIKSGSYSIGKGKTSVNYIQNTEDNHYDPDGSHEYTLTLTVDPDRSLFLRPPGSTFYHYRLGAATTTTITVADDDGPPVASFASGTSRTWERDGAHGVRVNISPTFESDLTLNYTVGGTASSGTDYAALPGSVRVPRGASSVTIPVAPVDDGASESDETVVLTLAGGTNYSVGSGNRHTVTVVDDRNWSAGAPPMRATVSYAAGTDVHQTYQGHDLGFDYRRAIVTLPIPRGLRGRRVTLFNAVSNYRNGNTASRGFRCALGDIVMRSTYDYVDFYNPPLSSAANGTVEVPVNLCPSAIGRTYQIEWRLQDIGRLIRGVGGPSLGGFDTSAPNCDHTNNCSTWVTVVPGTTSTTALSTQQGEPVDVNDPPAAQFGSGALNVHEANVETGVVVKLSRPATEDVVIDWEASGTATFGTDYSLPGRSTQAGMVTIPAGSLTATIPVQIIDDAVEDSGETVVLTLTNIAGADAVLGTPTTFTLTIENDDTTPPPQVSIAAGAGVDEGGNASFTLTSTPAPKFPLSVSVTVGQSGDYAAPDASGARTVTIPPAGSVTFTVATVDDTTDEADGSITATVLGTSYSYTVASASQATVQVADNDEAPEIAISGGDGVSEGESASFTLTASPAPTAPLPVSVTIGQSGDYAASGATVARTVTIPPAGSVTFTVATVDDTTDEADGSITATLGAGQGYTVASASSSTTVAVSDDDNEQGPLPQVAISGGDGVSEGGNASFTLTATPTPTAPLPISVTVGQSGDYAASGATGA